jgi:uncharacterized protein
MIPPEIEEQVRQRLVRAQSEHDVRILHAIESGSRAWGFASPNSDYDGRFIYVNRPDWYLSVTLEEQRDVIEYPVVDDLDVNGWDLRKALRLFMKSNPGFVEWIQSPIVYQTHGSFHAKALELLPQIYSIERGVHHYRSMAKTNFRGYLQGELVPLKKYFYVLRPLLSVRWLLRERKPAPIEFRKLLVHLDLKSESSVRLAIEELLVLKSKLPEMGLAAQIPAIQSFIVSEMLSAEQITVPRDVSLKSSGSILNELFRDLLISQKYRRQLGA